jgi:hypothetical protein
MHVAEEISRGGMRGQVLECIRNTPTLCSEQTTVSSQRDCFKQIRRASYHLECGGSNDIAASCNKASSALVGVVTAL